MNPHITLYVRIGLLHHGGNHMAHRSHRHLLSPEFLCTPHHEDLLRIQMKTIVGMLVHYEEQDRHTNGQPQSESADIDGAVERIPDQIPDSSTQIAEDHMSKLGITVTRCSGTVQ